MKPAVDAKKTISRQAKEINCQARKILLALPICYLFELRDFRDVAKMLIYMVRPARLELATF